MESAPGEEMQVDFGLGAMIEGSDGRRRRSWVLRAVLSYSRKGYSEAVYRQDTETFLRVLENAFRHFGGAPLVLNLDNLKAAVIKPDWHDPEINPKLAEFCRHYGVSVLPCRPATPQHKGNVERGVAYVRNNALKGRRFATLEAENTHLAHWESQVADTRIHGTTCKQVAALFAEERPHLKALPGTLFPCYQEARRTVGRDSFVEVAKSFYEAPPEYIGQRVWVRWDGRAVRILNERLEQVQIHTRIEPGKFSRSLGTGGHSRPVVASCRYWIERLGLLGSACQQWAQNLVDTRGPEALRSLMGLTATSARKGKWKISKNQGNVRVVKTALDTMKNNGLDRDIAFWAKHPGIVWSNPHASDAVMIGNALLRGNAATLADIAEHFGTNVLWERWRQLQSEYERFPSDLKAVHTCGSRVEKILQRLAHA